MSMVTSTLVLASVLLGCGVDVDVGIHLSVLVLSLVLDIVGI